MKKDLFFLILLTLFCVFNNEVNYKQLVKEETLKNDKHLKSALNEVQRIFMLKGVINPSKVSKLNELNCKGLSHEEIIFNCNKQLMEITE